MKTMFHSHILTAIMWVDHQSMVMQHASSYGHDERNCACLGMHVKIKDFKTKK